MVPTQEGQSGYLSYRQQTLLLALLLLACLLSISGSALANPVGFSVSPTIYLLFVYLLLVANLPVNLLFFSAILLAISRIKGVRLGCLQQKTSLFVWTIVLTMLIVSAVGAVIDFFLVFVNHDVFDNTLLESYLVRISVATGLIFLSVLIPSHYVIGLRLESNLVVSTAMALMNPMFWYFLYPLGFSMTLAATIAVIVVSGDVFVLSCLAAWHKRAITRDAENPPRVSSRALRRIAITYFAVLGVSFILAMSIWGLQGERTYGMTPTSQLTKQYITWDGCWRFTFTAIAEEVSWDDVTILLEDDRDTVWWTNILSSDLDDGFAGTHDYGTVNLGEVSVTLTVLDLSGNGCINGGDYFALTSWEFYEDVTYTVMVIYEPTDGSIAFLTFTL